MANNRKSWGIKWLILVLLLAAVGGGASWYFRNKGEATPEFTIAKVTRGELTRAATATGHFGFSAAVGICFGLHPARKAARRDPIDALRYE